MSELILKPGPSLIWREWVYDETNENGSWVDSSVTHYSHEYLFEIVNIEDGVLLADIFRLLDSSPILMSIFRRSYSQELLDEAKKVPLPNSISEYSPEAIEFLELYQSWNLNTATREYEPLHLLDFHGIGYLLREDLDQGNGNTFVAGTRIHWSISTTPLRELLNIPIRINHVVCICENDLSAKKYSTELEKVLVRGFNLSQILHGILWELSWHGGPDERSEFVKEIKSRIVDKDVISTTDPFDEAGILGELDEPGFTKLFLNLGNHSKKEVSFTLLDLEDGESVQSGLRARLGDDIVIRPEYATLDARAFRTLFRNA